MKIIEYIFCEADTHTHTPYVQSKGGFAFRLSKKKSCVSNHTITTLKFNPRKKANSEQIKRRRKSGRKIVFWLIFQLTELCSSVAKRAEHWNIHATLVDIALSRSLNAQSIAIPLSLSLSLIACASAHRVRHKMKFPPQLLRVGNERVESASGDVSEALSSGQWQRQSESREGNFYEQRPHFSCCVWTLGGKIEFINSNPGARDIERVDGRDKNAMRWFITNFYTKLHKRFHFYDLSSWQFLSFSLSLSRWTINTNNERDTHTFSLIHLRYVLLPFRDSFARG